MEVLNKPPSIKGPAETFTGDVWIDIIVRADEPSRLRVAAVHFAPCARTDWHTHALGQTLFVTEGVGYVQARGGQVVVMHPGDVVYTPPGEWHWHGAAPGNFMTHLAMWEGNADGTETTWGEPVNDAEYQAGAG